MSQLSPDSGLMDEALEELQAVLTLEVLRINYQHRKRRHMRRKHIQRQIMLIKAEALRD
jgi:predicted metal-dependent peptidase